MQWKNEKQKNVQKKGEVGQEKRDIIIPISLLFLSIS